MTEIKEETLLEYFDGDELAANVWKSKYAAEREESPHAMHWRMAKEFARIEYKYQHDLEQHVGRVSPTIWNTLSHYGRHRDELDDEAIYNLFKDFKYIIPQGSIMSMLGSNKIGSLSNCFVVGQPVDSYGGILQKDQQLVQLMKRRGGVGLDISTLRPSGTNVTNAAGTSTGAASFMERFSNTTREVAQAGRRGALMLTIDCRHPDVFEFVNAKKDRTKVTGANISVMLRDDFMEAVKNDSDYILQFPCNKDIEIPSDIRVFNYNELVTQYDPTLKQTVYLKLVKAKELYDSIVENAWENAEPGQMFIDKQWDYSPDGVYPQYKGVTTNPCGEIFMQPYDACRLMALNLYSFVENPFTESAKINYDLLYKVSYEQQRLADDLVDLELEHIERIIAKIKSDPEPDEIKQPELELWSKIYNVCKSGRRTGCGFTALGDMLAALNMRYDSDAGLEAIDKVMKTKMEGELDCTIDLAILRGTFDGWDDTREFIVGEDKGCNSFYDSLIDNFSNQVTRLRKFGRRNISWSTVAPTGSVSILTQTSSGLEPLFQPYYMRRKKINPADKEARVDFTDQSGDKWQEFPVLHPKFKDWYNSNQKLQQERIEREEPDRDISWTKVEDLTKSELDISFKYSPWYNSCANNINWIKRVEIQSIIQKYTTHSISSTINLPENVTKEEVAEIYIKSYDAGLKGVTIYRDNCRTGVLVAEKKEDEFKQHHAPKRPEVLECSVHTTTSKGKKYNVFVGMFQNKPFEIFATPYFTAEEYLLIRKVGKGKYNLETKLGETYSEDFLSELTDEEAAITRLISTSLRHGANIQFIVEQLGKTNGDITSFTKAIARTLKKYISEEDLIERAKCQECNSTNLRMEEGCLKCLDCGSSKC